ncbi:MAG: hypothetical protein OEZ36_01050 [Spirochaetota bacterium]|nr:hypothetical protein [Spirochaetota bacterium]
MKSLVFTLILILAIPSAHSRGNKQKDVVIISADKKKYHHKKEYWDLIGNPMIKNGQDTITGDSLKYYSKRNKGEGIGNVKIFDHENTIEIFGSKGEYFTKTKYARLTTKTKLFAIKDSITMYSNILERFGKRKICVARENVKIILEKDDAIATAQRGTYDIKARKVTLDGNPRIIHNDASYSANRIIIYNDTREIIFEGQAEIKKENKKVLAEKIHYYSRDSKKKSVLTGNPRMIEYSADDSLLQGKPFRESRADEVIYYNVGKGKALLKGRARYSELFVREEEDKKLNVNNFYIYKRHALADKIYYIGGSPAKYKLLGDARIFEPNRAAYARRIDYVEGKSKVAVLTGDPVMYEFFKKDEPGYERNKIKRKARAEKIRYYFKEKRLILEKDAQVFEENNVYSGESIGLTDNKNPHGYIKGNAEIKREDDYASADVIKYYKNQNKIVLSGNSYYENDDIQAEADLIEHDDKKKKTRLKGNAWVYDNGKEAYGDDIEYFKENGVEKAFLKGNPRLVKDGQTARAKYIEYTKENDEEVVFLTGKGQLSKKDKSIYADEIVYYTYKRKNQDEKDEKVVLKDKVRIVEPDRITSGDKGEFYISKKPGDKYEKGFLTGNCEVRKTDGKQQAFSDDLEYIKEEGKQETITLKGNAEMSDDRKAGYAKYITIYPKSGEQKGDRVVLTGSPRIETEDSYATGKKIEIIEGKNNLVKIYNDAEYINEKDDIKINSGYMVYDEKKDIVRAEKEAELVQKKDDLKVNSTQLVSYRKKKISIATGDVKINQGKKDVYGERAKFIEKKKRLEVTGNASLVENKNVTRAKKIVMNTKDKTVKLIKVMKGQVRIKNKKEKKSDDKSKSRKKSKNKTKSTGTKERQ